MARRGGSLHNPGTTWCALSRLCNDFARRATSCAELRPSGSLEYLFLGTDVFRSRPGAPPGCPTWVPHLGTPPGYPTWDQRIHVSTPKHRMTLPAKRHQKSISQVQYPRPAPIPLTVSTFHRTPNRGLGSTLRAPLTVLSFPQKNVPSLLGNRLPTKFPNNIQRVRE